MMRPVPILYFIDFLYMFSGTERHLYDLVSHLDRDRFQPFVLAFRGSEEFRRRIECLGVPARVLSMPKIYGMRPARTFLSLRKFLREERIRVLQTFHSNPDIYGTLLARASGVPAVISSRRDLGLGRTAYTSACYPLLGRYVDRVICVSEEVKRFVMREEGLPEKKTRVIYNGIDAARLDVPVDAPAARRSLGIPAGAPVFGMLANFNPVKGHGYFLEAAARIKRYVRHAWFFLPGDGPTRAAMRRKAGALGLGACTVFPGHRNDVEVLLSVMDVLVSASLSEGFSNALLEALYLRRPVVATRVGGNPEVVRHGQTGLLVPPGDPEEIVRAAMRLYRDRDAAARLGENGRRAVERDFLLAGMVRNTMALYDEVLREKRERRGT